MNEINSANADTGYRARGVPALHCHFSPNVRLYKWQKENNCRSNVTLYIQMNIYLWLQLTHYTANRQKEPFQTDAHMQKHNQSTETQTTGGLEQGSSTSLTKEQSLDLSDFPNLSDSGFLQTKRAEHVPVKKQVSLRIDEDILEFFKVQGSRYQTKMHAVLRAYVDGCKAQIKSK